jgi:arsenate reductase-like glutaredoxin family protein
MIDVKKMTRARAEKLVAATTDEDSLSALANHQNSHVRTKVAFKRLSVEDRRNATAVKYLVTWLRQLNTATAVRFEAEALAVKHLVTWLQQLEIATAMRLERL